MMIVMLLSLLVSFYLIKFLISLAKKPNKLPPGPVPLPIIASLHKIGHHPHKSLSVLSKKYGPIMHPKLGSVSTIVISSSNAAKQILQKQDQNFATRSVPDALNAHNHYEYSVAFLPANSRWRSLRKIMNSNIFSGNKLDANQHLRSKKVEELVEYCRKCSHAGEAVDIGQAAFSTSLNILSNTISSKDLMDAFDDSGKEFRDLVWNIMVEVGKPNVVDFFPILKKIDPQGVRRRLTLQFGKMLKILGDLISERVGLRKSDEYVPNTDVIDQLLNNCEVNSDEIHQTQIEHLFLELFTAGTDTTSSTLEWAMTELVRDSKAMAKAKGELNQVMGKGKIVQEADVGRLPYVRAIVKETLRLHPSVPLLLPRKAQEEADDVCGYTIPKGSQILVNAWAIGRDPAEWDNPLAFLPERFLDSDVDFKGQHFELIPFGGGRRICPGMPLVARVVPVVLGSLLNLFDWEIEGGIQPMELDMEEKFGISLQKLHSLRAIPTCCS